MTSRRPLLRRLLTGVGAVLALAFPSVVAAAAPVNLAPPSISGSTALDATLTCDKGTWSGATYIATYWFRLVGSTYVQTGEYTATHVVVHEDSDTGLMCQVVASGGGSSTVRQAFITIPHIAPAVPTNTGVPSLTIARDATRIGTGVLLTCSSGDWTGAPTGYAYAWTRGTMAIPLATSATYALVAADDGSSLSCSVTASNEGGPSLPASSTAIPITFDPVPPPPPVVRCHVPKLVGLTLASARSRLANAHCAVGKVTRKRGARAHRGRVLRASKSAGVWLTKGTKINLVLGS